MASTTFKIHLQPITTPNPPYPFSLLKHPLHCHVSSFTPKPKTLLLPPLHSSSSPSPPTSKDEAILQAKTCLSSTLQKLLTNSTVSVKLKKLKQPRFRIEIPIIDDSPDSLSQLAGDFFRDLPIKGRGSPVKLLIIWPHIASSEAATENFQANPKTRIEHSDMTSVSNGGTTKLSTADVAVILAPGASDLGVVKAVSESFSPKPVVMLNPKWGVEEENGFGELRGFVGSFEVIYSFVGLEVKGFLSNKNGVIFKMGGHKWTILVEEGGNLKATSMFETRPSIEEVESVLYNVMAVNSPITKSVKFIKDLVSNVTRKKKVSSPNPNIRRPLMNLSDKSTYFSHNGLSCGNDMSSQGLALPLKWTSFGHICVILVGLPPSSKTKHVHAIGRCVFVGIKG